MFRTGEAPAGDAPRASSTRGRVTDRRRCRAVRVLQVDPSAYTPPYDHALSAALAAAGADVTLATSRFGYAALAPLAITAHDGRPREPRGPGHEAAQRRLYDRVDAVVVHSEHGRRRLVGDLGVAEAKVEVIPHGAFTHLTELAPAPLPLPDPGVP